jgi:hypothetical protein
MFKNFLVEQLPSRIQQRMQEQLQPFPQWLRESLQNELIRIVRQCTEDAYNDFPSTGRTQASDDIATAEDVSLGNLLQDGSEWQRVIWPEVEGDFEFLNQRDLYDILGSLDPPNGRGSEESSG